MPHPSTPSSAHRHAFSAPSKNGRAGHTPTKLPPKPSRPANSSSKLTRRSISSVQPLQATPKGSAAKNATPKNGAAKNGAAKNNRPTFWTTDSSTGEVTIDRGRYIDFLEREGFGKIYHHDDHHSTLVRVEDQVVERTSAERVKDHVLDHVRRVGTKSVENKLLRGATTYFSSSLLQCLQPLDLTFQRGAQDEAFFYFDNGFVRVTSGGYELKPYTKLDGAIWKDQILDRSFDKARGEAVADRSEWLQFLVNVTSPGHQKRLQALLSAIGYLLHDWRDPATAKAIVFMDEVDTDAADGRTGKSLVAKSLQHLVPTVRLDGRNVSFGSRFRFQQIRPGTRVVDFNDASRDFDFERLFSALTDDWTVERKNRDAVSIRFEHAPNVVISTNYVLDGQGASFDARVFPIEFAPHYDQHHTPVDEFGHRLFFAWDADEWAAFDVVMMRCVQLYLRKGLVPYDRVNVTARQLKQATCADFAEWAPDYIELGRTYPKTDLLNAFKAEYAPDYDRLTPQRMGQWLSQYARICGLVRKDSRPRCDGGRVRCVTINEKA